MKSFSADSKKVNKQLSDLVVIVHFNLKQFKSSVGFIFFKTCHYFVVIIYIYKFVYSIVRMSHSLILLCLEYAGSRQG